MNFLKETPENIQKYGRDLLNHNRDAWDSFEAVSNQIVNNIYHDFLNDDGERVFELVRIFRMVTADDLPPEGQQKTANSEQWLALVATTGKVPAWNNRLESEGHRLLPSGAFETPMLKATFSALGLRGDAQNFARSAGLRAKYFHVEQAAGSPYIVVQDDFVKRYGIKSVVGIGSPFMSKSVYIMLGFASTRLDDKNAQKFANLAPFIGTLLAGYEESDFPTWKPQMA